MSAPTRIAIVGAGAVGGLVAWHLARAGEVPTIVAREATAALITREGLTLTEDGRARTAAVRAVADPAALGAQDIVFAGFKAQDWPACLGLVTPLLGPDTTLIPMLNGVPWWFFQGWGGAHAGRRIDAVDREGTLAAGIAPSSILGCVLYVASWREAPNRIAWNRRRRIVLGEPSGKPTPRLATIVAMLDHAGFETEATADIRGAVWHKLLGNAPYNPLSVVTDATIGAMARDPAHRRTLRAMIEELVAVGRALGACGEVDVEARLQPPRELENFRTSTLQDFDAGRPLELGALVDAPVELGRLVGVPTPTLAAVGEAAAARWRARHGRPPQAGTG